MISSEIQDFPLSSGLPKPGHLSQGHLSHYMISSGVQDARCRRQGNSLSQSVQKIVWDPRVSIMCIYIYIETQKRNTSNNMFPQVRQELELALFLER